MVELIIAGCVFLMIGLVLIIWPAFIIKLNEDTNKVLFTDSTFFSSPKISGFIFLIIGILFTLTNFIESFEYELAFMMLGVITALIGLVFIIKPRLLIKFNETGNRIVFEERHILNYPRLLGAVVSLISTYMIYLGITL
ncbi:hypothetical protein ACFL4T_11930 [candidate division KSB1 bacterium]